MKVNNVRRFKFNNNAVIDKIFDNFDPIVQFAPHIPEKHQEILSQESMKVNFSFTDKESMARVTRLGNDILKFCFYVAKKKVHKSLIDYEMEKRIAENREQYTYSEDSPDYVIKEIKTELKNMRSEIKENLLIKALPVITYFDLVLNRATKSVYVVGASKSDAESITEYFRQTFQLVIKDNITFVEPEKEIDETTNHNILNNCIDGETSDFYLATNNDYSITVKNESETITLSNVSDTKALDSIKDDKWKIKKITLTNNKVGIDSFSFLCKDVLSSVICVVNADDENNKEVKNQNDLFFYNELGKLFTELDSTFS